LIVLAGVSFEEFSEEKTGYSNLVIDEVWNKERLKWDCQY
jgi:hypothetical protein